jgi:hypothetical protein
MSINTIFLWSVTAVSVFAAVNTGWKLFLERHRLRRDDLSDEDRALIWQTIFFLILPLVNLLDLRSTMVACNLLGGYVKSWSYGFLWFQVLPAGLPDHMMLPVLLAGPIASMCLALLLIPPLFFRPHPFLACILGYTAAFIISWHIVVNPLLSLAGLTGGVWDQLLAFSPPGLRWQIIVAHVIGAASLFCVLRSALVRMWFSELTRPNANRQLREALIAMHGRTEDVRTVCQIGLLYDRAGLKRPALKMLKTAKAKYPDSLYMWYLESLLAYRRREYKNARRLFVYTSERRGVDGELKASLLAAAACAAFASGDLIDALNLSERALEFDTASLVARMVKVDVFLRQGKRDHAGEEILTALHLGLSLELENKVPLDVERAFEQIVEIEERERIRTMYEASPKA